MWDLLSLWTHNYTSNDHCCAFSKFHDGVVYRSNKSTKHNEIDHNCILEWNVIEGSRNYWRYRESMINWTVGRSVAVAWLLLSLILISQRFNLDSDSEVRGYISSGRGQSPCDLSVTDIWLHNTNSIINQKQSEEKWSGKHSCKIEGECSVLFREETSCAVGRETPWNIMGTSSSINIADINKKDRSSVEWGQLCQFLNGSL